MSRPLFVVYLHLLQFSQHSGGGSAGKCLILPPDGAGKTWLSRLGKLGTGARNIRLDRVSFEIGIFTRRLMIDTIEPVMCIFILRYRNDRVRSMWR